MKKSILILDWFLTHTRSVGAEKERIALILTEAADIFSSRFNTIAYNENLCLFHNCHSKCCARHMSACEQDAVRADWEAKQLTFDPRLCAKCGSCVGVCPTGAVEMAVMPREVFKAVARLYDGLRIFVIEADKLEFCEVTLPAGTAPFVVPNMKFIDLDLLIVLLQESGSSAAFFGEAPRCAGVASEIWRRVYGQNGVGESESLRFVPESRFSANCGVSKRVDLMNRLKFAVGEGDFGAVAVDGFGHLNVDRERCTLCMDCVQSCKSAALIADNGVLKVNDSLCAICGECEAICPEKAIAPQNSGIRLNRSWFETRE
jgi:Fe-S-cluster-containing hydrogenase component 2